jgi:peroxiredoxin
MQDREAETLFSSWNIVPRIFVLAVWFFGIAPLHASSGQVGQPAPAFELPDAKGRLVSLESFKGKVLFLNFWAPWCLSCRMELPELERLNGRYGEAGFEVIGIGLDASEAAVTKFLQKTPLSFSILLDKKGKLADAYRVSGLPSSFIVSRDGIIRYQHLGFEKQFVTMYEREIEELLKAQ